MTSTVPPQPAIGGATRLLGFVGDPVIHARSPQSFNPRIAAAGHDAALVPIHLTPATFDAAITGVMAIENLDGLVVTMPFKQKIIPHLDAISARARAVGAVNAARRAGDGRWLGDIFDGVGLIGALESLGLTPRGLRVGLIGAGGAGAAIAFALAEAGAASLAINSLHRERAQALAQRITASGALRAVAGTFDTRELDLLINATPVGMASGDGIAIDISGLTAATAVIDIVTRPSTPLLEEAQRRGCRHAGGAVMVAAQTEAMLRFFGLSAAGQAST
jgi:shikimate dehydrogenase